MHTGMRLLQKISLGFLSAPAHALIKKYTNEVKTDPVDAMDLNNPATVDLFLHSSLWSTPTLDDYLLLAKDSEYAAWVIYNRYYLNHFTVSVHNLKEGYNTIQDYNYFLESNGFVLNTAGGKYKKGADGYLHQKGCSWPGLFQIPNATACLHNPTSPHTIP